MIDKKKQQKNSYGVQDKKKRLFFGKELIAILTKRNSDFDA